MPDVWGNNGKPPDAGQPGLAYETFVAMVRAAGLDAADKEHLARLYEDTRGLLRLMAALEAIDAGDAEPAGVSPAGAAGPGPRPAPAGKRR